MKKIATENFNIDITNLQKNEICDAIELKMNDIYKGIKDNKDVDEKRNTVLELENVDKILDL